MGSGYQQRPPGPRYLTPFGAEREMRRDPLGFVARLQREHGDLLLVRMGPIHVYMLFHPDHAKHVLQENHANYVKGPIIARVKVLFGEGLFTSEGSFWRRQRRLAQPAFHRERIAALVDTIVGCTDERLRGWDAHVRDGRPSTWRPRLAASRPPWSAVGSSGAAPPAKPAAPGPRPAVRPGVPAR